MNQPKYKIIKNKLKDDVIQGIYKTGEKIPSERQLSTHFKVSVHTIRQAVKQLVDDGYLIKIQGSGTYVSDNYKKHKDNRPTKTIGLITTYVSDYIFPTIIRGIEEVLSKNNYSLLLASTNNDVENEKKNLEKMLNQSIAGLIIEPTKSSLVNPNLNYYLDIYNKGIPLLMLHANYDELITPVIGMDDEKAGKLLTEHLIKQGHKEIVMISKTDDKQGKKRLKGFIEMFNKYKLSIKQDYIVTYETETRGFLPKKIQKILNGNKTPTAFICYNDQVAIEVIQEIQKIGKSIPDDYSIVSFDDSYLSDTIPGISLTTIVHPQEEMGREAAKWIIESIEKNKPNMKSVVFKPILKIGNSTKIIKENTDA